MIKHVFQIASKPRLAALLAGLAIVVTACTETVPTDGRAVQRGIMAFQSVCMDRAPNYTNDATTRLFAETWGYTQPWIGRDRATGQARNLDPNVLRAADGGLAGRGLFGAPESGELGCLVYVPARNTDGVAKAISSLAASRMPIDRNPVTALSNTLDAGQDVYILANDKRGGQHAIVVSFKPQFQGAPLGMTLILIAPRSALAGG